jgi:predicted DNA-binding mobile mystery protein A
MNFETRLPPGVNPYITRLWPGFCLKSLVYQIFEVPMREEVRKRARQALDERLLILKPESRFRVPPKGWIRGIRDVLGMSSAQLGKRLGKRSQSVDDWEKAEANGSIQLKTLRQAADALDCTLVYALVPKTSLNTAVEARARKIAIRELRRVAHTMKLEAQATDHHDWEARIEEYIRANIRDRNVWNERD